MEFGQHATWPYARLQNGRRAPCTPTNKLYLTDETLTLSYCLINSVTLTYSKEVANILNKYGALFLPCSSLIWSFFSYSLIRWHAPHKSFGGPHMLNKCLRIPQPMYTLICCFFEHVLAYSWHFNSSGSRRWAQYVLAYHGIHHDQTICECLWLTRLLTVAAVVSSGSDSMLNWVH